MQFSSIPIYFKNDKLNVEITDKKFSITSDKIVFFKLFSFN